MDCMQAYFEFSGTSMCGIPFVTLEGTPDDWKLLLAKAAGLADLMPMWSARLVPILQQFVRASQGAVDTPFWRSLFSFSSMSGGDRVNGWLMTFLPYLEDGEPNMLAWNEKDWRKFVADPGGSSIRDIRETSEMPILRAPISKRFRSQSPPCHFRGIILALPIPCS